MPDSPNITAQLLGSGLIGLREGLESGVIVMVLVAFLVKMNRRDALRWVWLGVGAAIAMTVGVFVVVQYSAYEVSGLTAEAVAGVASLVAVAIVTSMVLWMRRASATISGDLRAGMSRALETGAPAVVALSFLAVGREGVETALFMVGYAEADTAWPLAGLLAGVLVAVGIAWAMYAGAVRINMATFFRYTGVFLIVVAAGILSYGVGALQTVGWLPGGNHRAFDISTWMQWNSWYGEVLRGVFNVTPTPTVLQLLVWAAYLGLVLALFLKPLKPIADSAPRSPKTPNRRSVRTLGATSLSAVAALLLVGCSAKKDEQGTPVTVAATDTGCVLSANTAATGATTFVVTNKGTGVTEFYVYGPDDRVLGEVEDISPGLQRQVVVKFESPGSYRVACKPGMAGDGIRSGFTVTG